MKLLVKTIVSVHARQTVLLLARGLRKPPHVQTVPTTVQTPVKKDVKEVVKIVVKTDVKKGVRKVVKTAARLLALLPVKDLLQVNLLQVISIIMNMWIWV